VSEDQINATQAQLSDRELEILRLVATGLSNKEIAAQLVLSPNTVKVHLRNIFGKIGVQSRTEATMYAVRQGWVEVAVELREAEAEESEAEAEAGAQPKLPSVATPLLPQPRVTIEPPLPWPQRIALILAVALVVAGLVITWPRATTVSGASRSEFSDLPGASAPVLTSSGETRWEPGVPMPTPRGRLALVSWRSRLYAIGGITSGGVTGAVEIYDILKSAWSPGATKPTPVANVLAVVLDDKIIVPGGFTSNGLPTNAVEVYDPATDTWSSGAALPSAVFAYALAVHDGKAYLFGGTNGRNYLNQVLAYDPATDRWTLRAPMPMQRGFAAAATLGDAIYVVGGYDGQREFATCERYLPKRDVWETCAPLAVGRGGLGLTAMAGRLYAIGGGWSGYLAFAEKYDPEANVWSPIETPLAGEWRNLAVATYHTDLYAVGGWNGQSYLAMMERYSPFPFQIFMPSP
jgi:DNA-binding CsgD family transcriptional regulator